MIKNIYIPDELTLLRPANPNDVETGAYYAVIEFKTEESVTVTKQLDIGGSSPREIGKRINVIYDPSNPTDIVTSPQLILRAIPLILMIGGVIGLGVSLLGVIFALGSE